MGQSAQVVTDRMRAQFIVRSHDGDPSHVPCPPMEPSGLAHCYTVCARQQLDDRHVLVQACVCARAQALADSPLTLFISRALIGLTQAPLIIYCPGQAATECPSQTAQIRARLTLKHAISNSTLLHARSLGGRVRAERQANHVDVRSTSERGWWHHGRLRKCLSCSCSLHGPVYCTDRYGLARATAFIVLCVTVQRI